MDKKYEKIIQILRENSRLTTREISKKTGIPITTVFKRIKKLNEEGIIRKFTIELDYSKVGKALLAYVLVKADLKTLKQKNKTQYDLAKELKKIEGIQKADIVTGGRDLIAQLRAENVEELEKILLGKIQKIDGISDTQTLVVIHED